MSKRDEALDAVFHALSDTTRRRIVDHLARHRGRGPISVGAIAEPFPISLAAVSKHLDVLEHAGLVRRARDGRFQRCTLQPAAFDAANDFISAYREFWDATLDQLAAFAEAPPQPQPPPRKKRS